MGDEQRKIYSAYETEFRDFICALSGDKLDKSPMHVLRGLTRLRQICNSPALLPDGMLNKAVSAKIELLKEQVSDKAPHHKLVIFRSEEYTSELQSLMRISYAVFCWKKKKNKLPVLNTHSKNQL